MYGQPQSDDQSENQCQIIEKPEKYPYSNIAIIRVRQRKQKKLLIRSGVVVRFNNVPLLMTGITSFFNINKKYQPNNCAFIMNNQHVKQQQIKKEKKYYARKIQNSEQKTNTFIAAKYSLARIEQKHILCQQKDINLNCFAFSDLKDEQQKHILADPGLEMIFQPYQQIKQKDVFVLGFSKKQNINFFNTLNEKTTQNQGSLEKIYKYSLQNLKDSIRLLLFKCKAIKKKINEQYMTYELDQQVADEGFIGGPLIVFQQQKKAYAIGVNIQYNEQNHQWKGIFFDKKTIKILQAKFWNLREQKRKTSQKAYRLIYNLPTKIQQEKMIEENCQIQCEQNEKKITENDKSVENQQKKQKKSTIQQKHNKPIKKIKNRKRWIKRKNIFNKTN